MMETALHSTPRLRDVLREQVSAVGLGIRREALIAAVLVGVVTIGITIDVLRAGKAIDFRPEHQMLPGVLGLLLPLLVWRGEERFGAAFLWALPVDRRRHALARVFAGWVWLMAAVGVFVLWLLGNALLTGGNVLAEETLRLVPASFSPTPATRLDPAAVQTVRWAPEPLLWLVPFTSATATYLLASALALGVRHPLRWIAGTLFGLFLVGGISDIVGRAANEEWLVFAPSRLLDALFYGPYGVDALLNARTEHLRTMAHLSTGERVMVSRGLPDVAQWAAATLLWTGAGLVALWAAASRHRERRRG